MDGCQSGCCAGKSPMADTAAATSLQLEPQEPIEFNSTASCECCDDEEAPGDAVSPASGVTGASLAAPVDEGVPSTAVVTDETLEAPGGPCGCCDEGDTEPRPDQYAAPKQEGCETASADGCGGDCCGGDRESGPRDAIAGKAVEQESLRRAPMCQDCVEKETAGTKPCCDGMYYPQVWRSLTSRLLLLTSWQTPASSASQHASVCSNAARVRMERMTEVA